MSAGKPPQRIEWTEPPPPKVRKQQGSMWDPVAKALRSRPGQWARIVTNGPTGIASAIRFGTLKCFQPKGAFEVKITSYRDRWVADVYARYIGENGEFE